jgi:hypothetical protein
MPKIAKIVKKVFCKIRFSWIGSYKYLFTELQKKFFGESNFRDRVQGIYQTSDRIFAKIVFFDPKSDFHKKILANIFAVLSDGVSPWDGGV